MSVLEKVRKIKISRKYQIVIGLCLMGFITYIILSNVKKMNSEDETKNIVSQIEKLMVLPAETPILATVTNKNKLENKLFFKQSQNGDKVLIYTQAREAILYRPSLHKIIEVGTIEIPTPTPSYAITHAVNVTVYNGSLIPGLAGKMEKQLLGQNKNINVVQKTNASSKNYTKTLVIDIKGNKLNELKALAKLASGEASLLPKGEIEPATDFLIIVAP